MSAELLKRHVKLSIERNQMGVLLVSDRQSMKCVDLGEWFGTDIVKANGS
jgi:hypothetical protein